MLEALVVLQVQIQTNLHFFRHLFLRLDPHCFGAFTVEVAAAAVDHLVGDFDQNCRHAGGVVVVAGRRENHSYGVK